MKKRETFMIHVYFALACIALAIILWSRHGDNLLTTLATVQNTIVARESSYDKKGMNFDFVNIKP